MMFLDEVVKKLELREYDSLFADIYEDETMIDYQNERYLGLIKLFEENFGKSDIEIYSAPGRSEVSGNHTDHQGGMVLATSVNLDAIAVVAKRENGIIRLISDGYPMITVDTTKLEKTKSDESTSAGLIKGVAYGLKEAGYTVGGFDAYVTSNVLIGAGLSSSASFETLVGTIISGLYNNMEISSVKIAQVGQFAENVYFGKPCGLMDQMACSVGGLIHIDFKDAKAPVVNKVKVDFGEYGYSLCIVDTKGSHKDLTPDYAAIPKEMKEVAKVFGKELLSQVDEATFVANMTKVKEEVNDRALLRSIHFFGEQKRVANIVDALQAGDFNGFLAGINASGNSSFKYLQNVYTTNNPLYQGVSVGLATSEMALSGKGATRVHGGGFAGTIQAFVPDADVAEYKAFMDKVFGKDSCHILKVRKYGGMKVM